MVYLPRLGISLFALALIGLGIVHLLTGSFPVGLLPVPEGVPARSLFAYLNAILLVMLGVGVGLGNQTATLSTGIVLLVLALLLHVPRWVTSPLDGRIWTALFELIGLAGGAFFITGWQAEPYPNGAARPALPRLIRYGSVLFAGSLLVFGGLHVVYGPFIATLIPGWLPGPLFWAYFVGVAFTAAGISRLLNRQVTLSMTLLGAMFGLWVLVLHSPRVWTKPQSEPEWTSLLIALAMSGVSFALTQSVEPRSQQTYSAASGDRRHDYNRQGWVKRE